MKLRQKTAASTATSDEKPAKPKLVAIQKPEKKSTKDVNRFGEPRKRARPKVETRGGYREGAGRPLQLKTKQRLNESIYVSVTDVEKAQFLDLATKDKLTLSFYIRKRLDLPIESDE